LTYSWTKYVVASTQGKLAYSSHEDNEFIKVLMLLELNFFVNIVRNHYVVHRSVWNLKG